MKAKAHFITPTFVLHIDKHNLSVTFCPQSAVSSAPSSARWSPFTLASAGPRSNFKTMCPPTFSVSVPFVTTYLCITHLFLIISPLIFQFSLLCRPPSLHPFLPPRLKRFTSLLSQCLGTPPLPFDSILIFPSIFLHLFFSYPSSLSFCPATSCIHPLCALYHLPLRTPAHPPAAEIKPRWREPGPTTSPTEAQPHGPKKQTLKNKIKYIKTAKGPPLHGQCIFLDTISHFYTLPALLHPDCLCFSPSVCFAPSLLLFPSFSDRHCRSLDSEASLQ